MSRQMRFQDLTRFVLFLSSLVIAASAAAGTAPPSAKTPVMVFMCADNGAVSGTHELRFIYAMMRDRRAEEIPFCQSAYVGRVRARGGKEVTALAVTTGIGYVSSTACALQLMRHTPYRPTSIVFIGTSGFSPFVGGLHPPSGPIGCEPLAAHVEKNAMGSVCVTSGAFLMESAFCTETLSRNQCERPNCFRFNGTTARNRIAMDSTLSNDMRAANAGVAFPEMPVRVAEGQRRWWDANEAAADAGSPKAPRLVQCAEATLNAIFVGAQRDYLCREYTSALMQLPMREAVCVQAMEGFGFLKVMRGFPEVRVAIVRSASNYDMYPLRRTPDGRWEQHVDYVSREEHDAFVNASCRYSIKTASFVVANYFFGEKVDFND